MNVPGVMREKIQREVSMRRNNMQHPLKIEVRADLMRDGPDDRLLEQIAARLSLEEDASEHTRISRAFFLYNVANCFVIR